MNIKAWEGFKGEIWKKSINVREFIQENYKPYEGNEDFLQGPTEASTKLWEELSEMFKVEKENGIYDAEIKTPSSVDAYGAGYINKELEVIVGLQTDKPLKRAIFPNGGIRMVKSGLEAYGYDLDKNTFEIFTKYRKTHNEGVFSAYTPDIRKARKSGIVTGLPDAYGRGRIIGDYRRVALYGVERLIEDKEYQLMTLEYNDMTEDLIRQREEISMQINSLKALIKMAGAYGIDIGKPAENAKEAVQWTYFGYLAAVKEQNGAAMSIGRVSSFLDIYLERDLAKGIITEQEAQEYVDHFVMKLRIIRFLRTPAYDELFSGDPYMGYGIYRRTRC